MRDEVHELAIMESQLFDVARIDEHHPATTLDTAVTITESIDRGIELIMAAQGLQDQMAGWHVQRRNRRDRELGKARLRGKRTRVSRWMRQDEAAWSGDVDLIALAAGHHPGNVPANVAIVVPHRRPFDAVTITERRLRKSGDDRDLRPEVRTGRLH